MQTLQYCVWSHEKWQASLVEAHLAFLDAISYQPSGFATSHWTFTIQLAGGTKLPAGHFPLR